MNNGTHLYSGRDNWGTTKESRTVLNSMVQLKSETYIEWSMAINEAFLTLYKCSPANQIKKVHLSGRGFNQLSTHLHWKVGIEPTRPTTKWSPEAMLIFVTYEEFNIYSFVIPLFHLIIQEKITSGSIFYYFNASFMFGFAKIQNGCLMPYCNLNVWINSHYIPLWYLFPIILPAIDSTA